MTFIRVSAIVFLSLLAVAGCDKKQDQQQGENAPAATPSANDQATAPQPTPDNNQSTQQATTPAAGNDQSSQPQTEPQTQAATDANAPAPGSGGQLNIYNWSDYIGEHTVENFAKMTGIKVRYDVYDGNETLEAKLMAGNTGYDIVVPTGPYLGRQIKAGIYQKLDKSKLPNFSDLDPQILAALKPFDPNNEYAAPYFWGTVGIGINVDKVKKLLPDVPVDSLDLIMKPENIAKLKECGVTMLDSVSDISQVVLNYLGKDPHTDKQEDWDAFKQAMFAVRPNIKYFHSSSYINDLANGEICAAIGWSGDIFIAANRATEAKNGVTIEYHIPKEGSLLWVDSMAIPHDAPDVDNAHKFLNYVMDPHVAADGVNFVNYASPVMSATQYVNKDITSNPDIYPTDEVKKKLFADAPVSQDLERIRTRVWTEIKTGASQ
ncbi:MAG TPA: extracellular solute-binding protein [Dongiaceae bacterium]|nr:extracellular solute-binding protein [Dongiaceae bacterium]